MRASVVAIALVLAVATTVQGFVIQVPKASASGALVRPSPTTAPTTNITTNVCDLDWYYCPRDPGCITYTMYVGSCHVCGLTTSIRL